MGLYTRLSLASQGPPPLWWGSFFIDSVDADVHGPSYRGALGMSLVFLLVGLVVGVLLGYVGAVARRASRPGDEVGGLRAEAARWQARAEELSRRVESAEARSQGDASVLQALAPVRAQLEQMTQRVDQMEQTRARQHGALAEQLRDAAQREADLARTTASLEGPCARVARAARGVRSSSPVSWRPRA